MNSVTLIPSRELEQLFSMIGDLSKSVESLSTDVKSLKTGNEHPRETTEKTPSKITEEDSLKKVHYCVLELDQDNFDDNRLKNICDVIKSETPHIRNFSNMLSLSSSTTLNNLRLIIWDVSNGINFSSMFSECSFDDSRSLSLWNVSNGTNFSYMFGYCDCLKSLEGLSRWNVSNGIDFSEMFKGCESLNDISPLSNWNVSKATSFKGMFSRCDSIKDIKPLANWCVPKNYDVEDMFKDENGNLPKNITNSQIDWLNKNIKRHN